MKLKTTCNSKASSRVAGQGAFLNYITRRILTEVPPNSPAYVIDFFEARRQLLTESERTALNSGADRQVQEPASRRERSLDLGQAFELGGYWVIWAAVVTGLALWDVRFLKLRHSATAKRTATPRL